MLFGFQLTLIWRCYGWVGRTRVNLGREEFLAEPNERQIVHLEDGGPGETPGKTGRNAPGKLGGNAAAAAGAEAREEPGAAAAAGFEGVPESRELSEPRESPRLGGLGYSGR